MNEELEYAQMLEIPVETVTVNRKEGKKRQEDLQDRLVDQVNEKMQEDDPAYAESVPISREKRLTPKERRAKRVLLGEFAAVCALCAAIFLTNIFYTDSAINTFVRGLFDTAEETVDSRVYSDFTLSPLVNDTVETEITVSSSGVLSFTEKCSVYSPCDGTISSLSGDASSGYSVEIKHSDYFSTIISGLDTVYYAAGDEVKSNLPLGYSNGEDEVRVMFYSENTLISGCVVDGTTLSWS